MPRRLRAAFTTLALATVAVLPVAGVGADTDPKAALRCVAPLDAGAIDSVLAAGGSPLAGQGATFVTAAASVGIDPRALVAVAAHESVLLTYDPAAAIHNPFGIGPNRVYPDDATAIAAAADLLATHYLGEGRLTIAQISGKWAPIGVANDPTNLNANWTGGVSALYQRLGGDPTLPITLSSQFAVTSADCSADTGSGDASGSAPDSPRPDAPLVPARAPSPEAVFWDGLEPVPTAPGSAGGFDPSTGLPATIDLFAFPVVPGPENVAIADTFSDAAPEGTPSCQTRPIRCTAELRNIAGLQAVAAVGGVLRAATADEQQRGIAFWIVTSARERIGYGGLAAYAPGIADRTAVSAGQLLGIAAPALVVAWERDGQPLNAAPLLNATRFSLR